MPTILVKSCLLALWVSLFIWLLSSGQPHLARLLHPKLWWLLVCGAVILLLFLGVGLRRPAANSIQISLWWRWPTLCILAVPLLYSLMLPSARFNAQTFAQRSIQEIEGITDQDYAAAGVGQGGVGNDGGEISLDRLHNEATSLAGRQVETVCQAMHDQNLPKEIMICYRFRITCCAADAMPVFIFLRTELAGSFVNDTWVRVRGRLSLFENRGFAVPMVTVDSMISEKEPAFPFLL